MGDKFSNKYLIGYFETDNHLKLKPSYLLVLFQDLAILHSDFLEYTLDYFAQKARGWAVLNWHIKLDRLPERGEQITVNTWANECKRMQAQRSFTVEDCDGNIICYAISRWAFMDLKRRRPVKIDESMSEKYTCDVPNIIENEKYNMPQVAEENFVSEREFIVNRSDTDTNNHVNNTRYIEWAVDDIEDELYYNYSVKDIKVVYRKECIKGIKIKSRYYLRTLEKECKETISVFSNEDVIYCEVAMIWKKEQ